MRKKDKPMPIKLEDLKNDRQDYFIVHWENDQLVMEPHCYCGNELEEDFYCADCDRKCDCTFLACRDGQALSLAEKLIHGEPTFKNFKVSLIG